MSTDPKPDDFFTIHTAKGSMNKTDSGRPDIQGVVDLLESQTRMPGILPELAVCIARVAAHIGR
jgi:hypothetical protein